VLENTHHCRVTEPSVMRHKQVLKPSRHLTRQSARIQFSTECYLRIYIRLVLMISFAVQDCFHVVSVYYVIVTLLLVGVFCLNLILDVRCSVCILHFFVICYLYCYCDICEVSTRPEVHCTRCGWARG